MDLLTEDAGLVRARVYGIRSTRSSLRGKVVPYARGTAWLYTDRRRDSIKITDFEVQRYAVSLSENLAFYGHASLWAEVVWKTFGSGGEEARAYHLVVEGLDLLDGVPRLEASAVSVVSMTLLWRYLGILGVQPDLQVCASSERLFAAEEARYFDRRESVMVGREWAAADMFEVTPGVVRLLGATAGLPLSGVAALAVTDATRLSLRRFILGAVQEAVDIPLNTLEVAAGWL